MFRRRHGFTLIEVLVAVGIISVLAGMLLSVCLEAREKARGMSCISNLKQVGTAATLYSQDYEETMVGTDQGGEEEDEDSQQEAFWADLLMPYLKAPRVFECPSAAASFRVSPPQPGFPEGISDPWSYSYALNDVREGEQHVGAAYAPLCAITHPTDTILLVDSWTVAQDDVAEEEPYEAAWDVRSRHPDRRLFDDGNPRHHSGFNLVFVDGHIGRRHRERLAGGRFSGGTQDREWLRSQW